MIPPTPRSTRTYTPFPYTPLFRALRPLKPKGVPRPGASVAPPVAATDRPHDMVDMPGLLFLGHRLGHAAQRRHLHLVNEQGAKAVGRLAGVVDVKQPLIAPVAADAAQRNCRPFGRALAEAVADSGVLKAFSNDDPPPRDPARVQPADEHVRRTSVVKGKSVAGRGA